MKIDFITSSLRGGGAERVLALMVNSLAKNRKYEITVITLYKGNEAYDLHSKVKRVQLKQSKLIQNLTLSSIVNLVWHYKKISHRPDIIVSFLTPTNFITIIVAKLFSIKIIAQEHNSYLRYMEGWKKLSLFTKKHLYKRADVVTVLTSFDVDFYKNYGVNVYVMPNPCSFQPIIVNSHKREKTILAVGNLNRYHHKGFDNLIELIEPILKENPHWQLKIAGSGEVGLKHLTKLAEEKKIADNIVFTGFIDNISQLMQESSVFILSSRYEGLPLVLLEAMSQGLACISYNCKTGPSDIIENNKNGILIEDQNMSKMQKGLSKLLNNEELRNALSNEGIKSLDKYDILAITKRYEILFDEIVRK